VLLQLNEQPPVCKRADGRICKCPQIGAVSIAKQPNSASFAGQRALLGAGLRLGFIIKQCVACLRLAFSLALVPLPLRKLG